MRKGSLAGMCREVVLQSLEAGSSERKRSTRSMGYILPERQNTWQNNLKEARIDDAPGFRRSSLWFQGPTQVIRKLGHRKCAVGEIVHIRPERNQKYKKCWHSTHFYTVFSLFLS